MKWTTEKPTEPGWYWIKDKTDMDFIRKVDRRDITGMCVDSVVGPLPVDSVDWQWAGPIPEPEE